MYGQYEIAVPVTGYYAQPIIPPDLHKRPGGPENSDVGPVLLQLRHE